MTTPIPNPPTNTTHQPAGRLAGRLLWQLTIAAAAAHGLYQVLYSALLDRILWRQLAGLSQLGSLVVAASYLTLAANTLINPRTQPDWAIWLRGALTVLMTLISLTAIIIFPEHGFLGDSGFLFEHLITPILVLTDFLITTLTHPHLRLHRWYPWTWLLPPLAYLTYLGRVDHFKHYTRLFNPRHPAQLTLHAIGFSIIILAIGYLLCWIATLPNRRIEQSQFTSPHTPEQPTTTETADTTTVHTREAERR